MLDDAAREQQAKEAASNEHKDMTVDKTADFTAVIEDSKAENDSDQEDKVVEMSNTFVLSIEAKKNIDTVCEDEDRNERYRNTSSQ